MAPLALLSSPMGILATVGACIGGLGALNAIQQEAFPLGRYRQALRLASMAGIALAIVTLAFGSRGLLIAVVAYTAGVALATIVAFLAESRLHKAHPLARLRGRTWGRAASAAFAGGLALLIAAGVAIGILLVKGGSEDAPSPFLFSSPYRVSGTCADGACTVNECRDPSPCGLDNEGRLREGKPLDIVCQVEGDVVLAPDGHHSHIWDRLPSGFYVSDLFVEETKTDKFTRTLPRCSVA